MLSVVIPIETQPGTDLQLWQSPNIEANQEVQDHDINQALLGSFKDLLKLYTVRMKCEGDNQPVPVSSGGLQQFMNRNSSSKNEANTRTHQDCKRNGGPVSTFFDLPECVHLHIFSYLDTKDLCLISGVCHQWNSLASDNLLWRQKLEKDVHAWNIIGYTTNPDMYEECQSDWSYKDIYLRCSPEIKHMVKQGNITFHHLSSLLRSFWPKKTPKIAMFGPGLESDTSRLARKILEDKSGLFVTTGMFPGQFEGVGSGFTMKMPSSTIFHLVTLYTTTRAERQGLDPGQRLQHNRLLGPPAPAQDPEIGQQDDEPEVIPEIRPAVKNLCRTLDGLIFVVDASQDVKAMKNARMELLSMVSESWLPSNIPLMVLSCIPEATSSRRLSSMGVVQTLRLQQLSRPWQVHNCEVEGMSGVEGAVEWLVEQALRR